MCATFEICGKTYKPGRVITGSGKGGVVRHVWAGFARNEILAWWQKKGAVIIDIPATRFAERSEVTRKLIWDDVEPGRVIRGIVDVQTTQPRIKVVTRASNAEELERFQHPRMPLLEVPLFDPVPPGAYEDQEADLFG